MRLIDTNIWIYFGDTDAIEELLKLDDLALTTSVRQELAPESKAREAVESAIAAGDIAVVDIEPMSAEGTSFQLFYQRDGFGTGEATSMAISFARRWPFYSHDLEAVHKAESLGVDARPWTDLVDELLNRKLISRKRAEQVRRRIEALMR